MVPRGVRKQTGLSPVQSAQLATTIQGEFKQSTQAKPDSSPRFSQEHGLGQSVDPVQTLTQVPLLQLPLQHSLSEVVAVMRRFRCCTCRYSTDCSSYTPSRCAYSPPGLGP
jgi:hypothetical protein